MSEGANDPDEAWHRAVRWIERNGGRVHPLLRYDHSRRRVRLGDFDDGRDHHREGSGATTTDVVVVKAGTILLDVPDRCLLTLHSVEDDNASSSSSSSSSSSFGKGLFRAVHSLQRQHRCGGGDDEEEERGLHHDAQDVILALYLAHLGRRLDGVRRDGLDGRSSSSPPSSSSSSTTPRTEAEETAPPPPWLFYEPYLATLPSSSSSSSSSAAAAAASSSPSHPAAARPRPRRLPGPSSSPHESPPPALPRVVAASSSSSSLRGHLPRQWSAADLRRRLCGTSLYGRVLVEKRGIEREYGLVREAWSRESRTAIVVDDDDDDPASRPADDPFPSFERYDAMMAAVSSRGFAGLGRDGVDAMIPLLDLLDHVRGPSSVACDDGDRDLDIEGGTGGPPDDRLPRDATEDCGGGRGPDVRYGRYEDDDGGADDGGTCPSKRRRAETVSDVVRGGGCGGVRVVTSRSLSVGSTLHMTYGAKGNASLLGRYGFAIPNNVEPDGSCNDVLEVKIRDNEPPVKLQRGPKSYSYGPFIKALELCRDIAGENKSRDDGDPSKEDAEDRTKVGSNDVERMAIDDGGLGAFLDSCENSSDDDNDDADDSNGDIVSSGEDDFGYCFYDTPANSNSAETSRSARMAIMNDIHAIDALREKLQNVKNGLLNNSLAGQFDLESRKNNETDKDNDNNGTDIVHFTVEDRYCLILIQSEIQTVNFYLAAASELRLRLVERLSSEEPTVIGKVLEDDRCVREETLRDHTTAIANTFLSIRYP